MRWRASSLPRPCSRRATRSGPPISRARVWRRSSSSSSGFQPLSGSPPSVTDILRARWYIKRSSARSAAGGERRPSGGATIPRHGFRTLRGAAAAPGHDARLCRRGVPADAPAPAASRRAPGTIPRSGRGSPRSASRASRVPEAHGGAASSCSSSRSSPRCSARGAVPVPFLGHALATLAIARGGSPAQQAAWLPRLAAGDALATVALARGRRALAARRVAASSSRAAASRGRKQFVPDGGRARTCSWSARAAARSRSSSAARGRALHARARRSTARARSPTLELDDAPRRAARRRARGRARARRGLVLLAADAFGAA